MPDQQSIAIIPARGGSKGIPRKNLEMLGGKPLIAWPIELARTVARISRIIVSTDDTEIAQVAQKYGAEVPFIRPAQLSEDSVATQPVLQHALEYLLQNEQYVADNVILLYATTPFLKKERIESGITLLESNACKSVVGVREVHGLVWKKNEKSGAYAQFYPQKRLNRQLFSKLYEEAGNIYFSKATVILNQDQIVDETSTQFIHVSEDEMLDIDSPEDLEHARQMLKGTSL